MKVSVPSDDPDTPAVESFIKLEYYNSVMLVQYVHSTLASLAKVIKGKVFFLEFFKFLFIVRLLLVWV